MLCLLMLLTYVLYENVLKISNYTMYFAYYLSNLPFVFLIGQYIFGVRTIGICFNYVNQLFSQVILQNEEPEFVNGSFKMSRPWSSDIAIINFKEIYSVYWNPSKDDKKNIPRSKENVNKEVQKFMEQLSGKKDHHFKKMMDKIDDM